MNSPSQLGLGSARGRRKQAKPQRKNVDTEAEPVLAAVEVKREVRDTPSPQDMSPDPNHNLQSVEVTMKLVKDEPESEEDDGDSAKTDAATNGPDDSSSTPETVPVGGGAPERLSPEQAEECHTKCVLCGLGLPSWQALREHVDSSHPGGAFRCLQCTASFPSRDQLEHHEQLHPAVQQVSCKVCNKQFANVYRLQRHMISHDESAVLRKFKCPECEKAFKFKHHLKEHIRIHSGEKPFKCDNCGKRFSHSGSYSSHMTSKKCLIMNLKVQQRGVSRAADLKPSNSLHHSAFRNQQSMKRSPTNNNGFPPILPKYEAAAAFLSSFPQLNPLLAIPYQNSPYNFSPVLNNLIEQLQNKTSTLSQDKIKELREMSPDKEDKEVVIKEEVKEEREAEEEQKSYQSSEKQLSATSINNGVSEEVKRILETVSARVTTQFWQESMQKLSPTSYSSGCPSVGSGAATPPPEEKTETLFCRFCKKTFTSAIYLHQHERYECNGDDEKSEGLAAKLVDVATKGETNGLSCSGSEDETRESRDLMTEDVEGDTIDQDGRKVRVRSQISEDQVIILKQNYTLNSRPKREELSRIAEQVNMPVRVVQVWFQNNRARDRRERRAVCVPYVPQSTWFPADSPTLANEQPLDLSTKKSQESSPAESPPRSDSEEAVNLSQRPQLFIRPLFPQRSPSPQDSSRLARMLTQPALRFPGSGPPMYYPNPEYSASRSPVPAVALYNTSSLSPGSDSWWKRNLVETPEADEFVYSEYSPKRAKVAAEPDSDGQLYCGQCKKSFTKQSSFTRHRYEHSGQRPYKCDVCLKAFKHKHHLTEHKRLHSGEKPFQCIKCLKRFSHSGSYSQHMNHRFTYCKPYRDTSPRRPYPPPLSPSHSELHRALSNTKTKK